MYLIKGIEKDRLEKHKELLERQTKQLIERINSQLMKVNTQLKQEKLSKVTKELFVEAIEKLTDGFEPSNLKTTRGNEIILVYGALKPDRAGSVSFRLYNNNIELLLTDIAGHPIYYSRFHYSTNVWMMANVFHQSFKQLSHLLEANHYNDSRPLTWLEKLLRKK